VLVAWDHPAALAGPTIDWARLRRVLVVRPDNIGDVVMCGPALRALRGASPDAELELLTSPAGAAVAPLLPEVDGVLTASVSWQQLDPAAVPARDDRDLIDRIRDGGYDAAVILTSFSQSPWPAAYLCRLAGVPIRVGMSNEFGGAGLTHWVPAAPDGLHQVDRALEMLCKVGVPSGDARLHVSVPASAYASARTVLRDGGVLPQERHALLLPGASCQSRRYDPERFAIVAGLLAEAGLRPIVAGTAKEADLVARASAGVPGAVPVVGRLDVPALAAVAAGSTVVVCNNSGGAHLASAVGAPVVVLFAGTEQPEQYAPRFTPAAVLTAATPCSPCRQLRCPFGSECLDIAPEYVAEQALRLAGIAAAGRRST
jgi:ADP-heptose:LPS heptosyltransferase